MNERQQEKSAEDAVIKIAGQVPSVNDAEVKKSTETEPPGASNQSSAHAAETHHPTSLQENDEDAHVEQRPEPLDESEAETLITSPVKKREAQKRMEGIKKEKVEGEGDLDSRTRDDESKVEVEKSRKVKRDSELMEDAQEGAEREDDTDEEEEDSSDLSLHSSASARSPEQRTDRVGDDEPDFSDRNSRKRKHRASSVTQQQSSMEPPRRRRRASTNVSSVSREKPPRSSEEQSPPPRLRSHRRTVSAQAENADGGAETNGQARQRRGASQFPVRDTKASRHTWESDTSSEASQQQQKNRLTRNANRSVSTPGRAMGRDHKRHVNTVSYTHLTLPTKRIV